MILPGMACGGYPIPLLPHVTHKERKRPAETMSSRTESTRLYVLLISNWSQKEVEWDRNPQVWKEIGQGGVHTHTHTLHAKLSLVGVCFKLASLWSKRECLAGEEGICTSGLDMSGVDGPLTWSIKRPADRRKLFFSLFSSLHLLLVLSPSCV